MSEYLREAALLAAEVPRNRCPATDSLQVLDTHPEIRLVLEDTWSDNQGRVYREVPAEKVSRWPTHLAKTFRSFLRISKQPEQVFRILDLLHQIDADKAVVRMTLTACRRRKSLEPAIAYYETLASELEAITHDRRAEEFLLGTHDVRCRPRLTCGQAKVGTWYLSDEFTDPEERALSPSYRAELLHDPSSSSIEEQDWITRQPKDWQRLHSNITHAQASDLPDLKDQLLTASKGPWSHDQLEVLWDTYRIRRDYLWSRRPRPLFPKLSPVARKLIQRIKRSRSRPEITWVGMNLYKAMHGELHLPGTVSEPEWSIVFDAYRARKAQVMASR